MTKSLWVSFLLFLFIVAVTLLGTMGDFARAQTTHTGTCGPRDGLVSMLGEKYKEALVATGHSNDGVVVEVYATVDGSTYTIIGTTPNGRSCIVSAGAWWQFRERVSEEPET